MPIFSRRVRLPVSAAEAFAWHARPGALERLNPPWAGTVVVRRTGGIEDGAEVELRVPVGPVKVRWLARHSGYEPGRQFRDVQVSGPFTRWEHTHRFVPDGESACHLEDVIEYALPAKAITGALGNGLVRGMLDRLFAYRHRTTAEDLRVHAAYGGRPLSVVISGASGLVGSVLRPFLTTGGHRVRTLVRGRAAGEGEIGWNPAAGTIERERLKGVDAVVHLAGESIATGRWSAAKKERILRSRVDGTRVLAAALAALRPPPRVLVSASAIGIYGDRADEPLDESSARGHGFLADVCEQWEAAAEPARAAGIRVVHLRFGVVLTPAGGALARMLPPFRLGAGGVLGSGRQYMSWVAIDDAVGAVFDVIVNEALSGPVNTVAPEPVTNAEFTKVLGRVLSRPTVLPVPAAVARLAFGEMADELLLGGARVSPEKLLATGYRFREPATENALRHLLGYRRA
jgi:hypothetical protein